MSPTTSALLPQPRTTLVTGLRNIGIVARRELGAYFATPLAYVFILIFLVLAAWFTFYLGGFFERDQADLEPFFVFHPWLYLFLMPALSMRLWSEERRSGSIELLLTQPITLTQAVVGKFLAAWACATLTFPIWITVNYLGHPDNGAILTGYFGSFLMAGAFLAVGSCMSALTRNAVVAFILGVAACFALLLSGLPMVLDVFRGWAPPGVVEAVASLSFLTHFEAIGKGVVDLRDVFFFGLTIACFLAASVVLLDLHKSQ
jgi:ABC-2 type transport system permease protein